MVRTENLADRLAAEDAAVAGEFWREYVRLLDQDPVEPTPEILEVPGFDVVNPAVIPALVAVETRLGLDAADRRRHRRALAGARNLAARLAARPAAEVRRAEAEARKAAEALAAQVAELGRRHHEAREAWVLATDSIHSVTTTTGLLRQRIEEFPDLLAAAGIAAPPPD